MASIRHFFISIFETIYRVLSFSRNSIKNTMSIFVRCNTGRILAVDLDPKWEIKDVKNIIAPQMNAKPDEVKIIFAGKELHDNLIIEECDLGQQSTLHAVKLKDALTRSATPVSKNSLLSMAIIEESSETAVVEHHRNQKTQFYVYCVVCKGMKIGKIRVRCSSCNSGAFIVDIDPKSWEDVLQPKKISGHCEQDACEDGAFGWAEFYFKCTEHNSGGDEHHALPLNLIRDNHYRIPCLACTDIKDIVFIFPCKDAHVTCLECFCTYSVMRLRERQFVLDPLFGYSIPCPAKCPDSLISDDQHFKIMSLEQYELYQKFATEECVLKNGGILCPQPGCGEGIFFEESGCNKIICANGCGYVFCRKCLQGYHLDDCVESGYNVMVTDNVKEITDAERASQARWDQASSIAIRITTKPCPKCRTATERSGGCMHMICSRCDFPWCWVCQTEWNRECMGTHWFG